MREIWCLDLILTLRRRRAKQGKIKGYTLQFSGIRRHTRLRLSFVDVRIDGGSPLSCTADL